MTNVFTRLQPGYFRIGAVTLDIPPEHIETNMAVDNQEYATLRGANSKFVKTGHTVLNFVIRFKSLAGEGHYALRHIVAYLHVAPFIEIENQHIRKNILSRDPDFPEESRIAVVLRQLKVETSNDIIDALDCTLTMTLFNYAPYSTDFGYRGENLDKSYSAQDSPEFIAFVQDWMNENFDVGTRYPRLKDWSKQQDGSVEFFYREYTAVPTAQPKTTENPQAPPPTPTVAATPKSRLPVQKSRLTGTFQEQRKTHLHQGVDLAVPIGTDVTPVVEGTVQFAGYMNGYQNTLILDHGNGVTTLYAHLSKLNVKKGEQVKPGTIIAKSGGDQPHLHYEVKKDGVSQDPLTFPLERYVSTKQATKSVFAQDNASPVLSPTQLVGWNQDHFTEQLTFLYKDQHIGPFGNDDCALAKVALVFVTSVAKIPFEGLRYPSFQSTGPVSCLVQLAFISADENFVEGNEPQHPEIAALHGMTGLLESQFQAYRGQWRAVSSVHRMQSVVVQNKLLNMLGIAGCIVQGFATETVPDQTGVVQASLICSRYENTFEQLDGYQIKNPRRGEVEAVNKVMNSGLLSKPEFNNRMFDPLRDFKKWRDDQNPTEPVRRLLQEDPNHKLPNVQLPTALTEKQVQDLQKFSREANIASSDPALAQRVDRGTINYTDYIRLTLYNDSQQQSQSAVTFGNDGGQYTSTYQPEVFKSVQQTLSLDPDKLKSSNDALFNHYFDTNLNDTNSSFRAAYYNLAQSPLYRDTLAQATQTDPNELNNRNNHGAYRDMGIKTLQKDGRDYNPGFYFRDHNALARKQLQNQMEAIAKTAVSSTAIFNKTESNQQQESSDRSSDRSMVANSLQSSGESEEIAKDLIGRTVIPFWHMNRAFPTFKLFLAEEDNQGPFYAFDDFYSYASVIDIDVIRYQDKPDTAVIQLTNLANLLSHKLFDNSTVGKYEAGLSNRQVVPTVQGTNEPVAGPAGRVSASENSEGVNSQQGVDLTSGFPGARKDFPLQVFPLQAGTKIQIRMGFSNDPDRLFPVFTGLVSDIQGDQILQVIAQGFLVELLQPNADRMESDGYLSLNTVSNSISKVFQSLDYLAQGEYKASWDTFGIIPQAGPAFGGLRLFKDGGDSAAVIEKMLKYSSARHFGHWQVDPNTPSFLKGYGWIPIASALAPGSLKGAISDIHDRSGDNILINRWIDTLGHFSDGKKIRPWSLEIRATESESKFGEIYSVPADANIIPWMYIKDISRRYPEYVLAVKNFGFPYQMDATLVFGHPNDYYISRPMTAAENGKYENLPESQKKSFQDWWKLNREPVRNMLQPSFGITYFSDTDKYISDVDTNGAAGFDRLLAKMEENARQINFTTLFGITRTLQFDYLANQILNKVKALRSSLWAYLKWSEQDTTPPEMALSNVRQPVRKFLMINNANIIHNGIELNEQFFNTVRLANYSPISVAGSMPDQYKRVLNCDALINNVQVNVINQGAPMVRNYAASFLKENVGQMYRGELVLIGMPEIESHDILLLQDSVTGMMGPVEVESVIHKFDIQSGFISIVKPRLAISINESLNIGLYAACNSFMVHLAMNQQRFVQEWSQANDWEKGIGIGYGVAQASLSGVAMMFLGPMGMSFGATNLFALASKQNELNPLFLCPLTRNGRPWVGGIDGWGFTDVFGYMFNEFKEFNMYEVQPTYLGMKELYSQARRAY